MQQLANIKQNTKRALLGLVAVMLLATAMSAAYGKTTVKTTANTHHGWVAKPVAVVAVAGLRG